MLNRLIKSIAVSEQPDGQTIADLPDQFFDRPYHNAKATTPKPIESAELAIFPSRPVSSSPFAIPSNTGLGFETITLRNQRRIIESTNQVPVLVESLRRRADRHPDNAATQLHGLPHKNLTEDEYQRRRKALQPYSIMLSSGQATSERFSTGRTTRYTAEFGIVRHTRADHNLYATRKDVALALMNELPPLSTLDNQRDPFTETIRLADGSSVTGTRNSVGVSIFATSDPKIFYAKQGDDFALVVGTVEQMGMYRLRTATQEQKVWQ